MAKDAAEQLSLVSQSPGALLRAARKAQNMNEREAADRLNWLPCYVTQIERDDYESLRSPAFARGYIRAYAKMLALDEEELIAAFEVLTDGTFAGGKGKRVVTQPLQLQRTGIGIVVGLTVLAAVVAGLWWWQSGEEQLAGETLRVQSTLPEVDPLSGPSRMPGVGG